MRFGLELRKEIRREQGRGEEMRWEAAKEGRNVSRSKRVSRDA